MYLCFNSKKLNMNTNQFLENKTENIFNSTKKEMNLIADSISNSIIKSKKKGFEKFNENLDAMKKSYEKIPTRLIDLLNTILDEYEAELLNSMKFSEEQVRDEINKLKNSLVEEMKIIVKKHTLSDFRK